MSLVMRSSHLPVSGRADPILLLKKPRILLTLTPRPPKKWKDPCVGPSADLFPFKATVTTPRYTLVLCRSVYATRRGVLQVRRWNERPGQQEVDFGAATLHRSGAATFPVHWRRIDLVGGASWEHLGNRGGLGNLWDSFGPRKCYENRRLFCVRARLNLEFSIRITV